MLPQRVIDEQQIMPRKGGIYRLCGSGFAGKAMRSYAEAWTAMALMGGQYVHWIDGACRFNPERILRCFPPTLPEANYLLRNLFIGRGFTVHQFSSLVERVADELSITEAQLIVVDGPVAMHLLNLRSYLNCFIKIIPIISKYPIGLNLRKANLF